MSVDPSIFGMFNNSTVGKVINGKVTNANVGQIDEKNFVEEEIIRHVAVKQAFDLIVNRVKHEHPLECFENKYDKTEFQVRCKICDKVISTFFVRRLSKEEE